MRSLSMVAMATALLLTPRVMVGQEEALGISVGDTAPAVTLEDLDGKPVDLGQYVGKQPVLLEFWARWCPNCKALEPALGAAKKRYGDRVAFVAIAVGVNENPASIKRRLAHDPIPYPVLWDGNGAATRAYKAPATSYIVGVSAAGKVVYTGLGRDQDIDAVMAKLLKG